MIDWISDWAGGIIIAVIIGTVIEMILPEGNSKKYIKVVIGVYVLFTIVSPVITKFTGKTIEVSDILDLDKYIEEAENNAKAQNTIQNSNEDSIRNIYISGIKDDMKAKIESKGYTVNSIDIEVSSDGNYSITSITLDIEEHKEENEEEDSTNNIEQIESVNKVEIIIGEDNNSGDSSENVNSTDSDGVNNKNILSSSKKKELKEYLSSVYEVNKDNITIN